MSNNPPELLPEAWASLDTLSGKSVTALQKSQETSGVVSGIDSIGALLLKQSDGNTQSIRAGEVTLRKQ